MISALESRPKFSQLFMAYLLASNSRIEEDLIVIQFKRETLGATVAAAGQFRQGSQPLAHWRHYQPGNAGRNDRNDPIAGQFFHE